LNTSYQISVLFFLGTFLPLQSAFSEPDKWSLNDDQSKVSTVHLGSECPQKMAVPPVIVHPHPGPCTQMFALPVLPPQQLSVSWKYEQITYEGSSNINQTFFLKHRDSHIKQNHFTGS